MYNRKIFLRAVTERKPHAYEKCDRWTECNRVGSGREMAGQGKFFKRWLEKPGIREGWGRGPRTGVAAILSVM